MLKDNERLDLIKKDGYAIIQNTKWFSYGIDAVLISHFSEIKSNDIVVDLGTGNGIIPLLLTISNTPQLIYGVEKQSEVAEMARKSIEFNGLDTIKIIESDVINISNRINKSSVDVVISNPPYFKKGDALVNDTNIKAQARHETSATLEQFIRVSSELLKEKGRFYMVHRPMRLVDIFSYCRKYNLEPKEIQFIHPHVDKPPNIVMIKCIKNGNKELKYKENLYVYDSERNYTDQIKLIYKNVGIDVF